MEEEAELGSDDEDKDDFRKAIDQNDEEENEDGLDDDLDGFVVHAADNEEIEDGTDEMYLKHQQEMEALDRMMI